MSIRNVLFGAVATASVTSGFWLASRSSLPIPEDSLSDLTSIHAQIRESDRTNGRVPGYLQALEERIRLRAHPYKSVDPAAYDRALEHSRLMPAAKLPGSISVSPTAKVDPGNRGGKGDSIPPIDGGGQETLPRYWEYFGPKGLGVPYNIYYGPTASKLNGRIGGLCFDPTDSNTMFMGAPAGGVWKTTDGGTTWRPTGRYLGAPYVGHVAVKPNDRNIVIAGLGDRDGGAGSGNGILRSTDGGETWTNIALRSGTVNTAVVFDPDNPNIVMATFYTGGGLFRSINGGLSWTNISVGGVNNGRIQDLTVGIKPATGSRMWTLHQRDSGTYVSFDQGLTWTLANEPGTNATRIQMAASQTNSNRVYYVSQSLQQVHMGDYTPGTGFTWTNITSDLPSGYNWSQSSYDNHVAVAKHTLNGAPQDYVYVGLITIAAWNGTTWNNFGNTYASAARTHNDQHCMAVFPGNNNIMVFGNDGGVYPLTYTPAATGNGTWNIKLDANTTLGITMFYSGAWHPTDSTRAIGGTQDNASPTSTGNVNVWVNRTGGDGCGVAINPVNPLVQYGSAQQNGLYRTSNGWTSQSSFGPSGGWGTDTLPFVTRMGIDPNSPNALYVATNFLWRYNASGATWDARLGGVNLCPNGGTVLSIAVAPSNSQVIYAGSSSGNLHVTTNGGTTWRRLDNITGITLGSRSVTWIDVSPTNANDILLTLGGTGTGNVFRIADTSLTTPVLTNRTGSGATAVPNIHTTSITRDDLNPATTWYLSNDIGVYMTTDGGATWSNATEPLGLPLGEVNRVEWVPGTGYLNAATYGRGMWRIRIRESRAADNTDLKVIADGTQQGGFYQINYQFINAGAVQANDVRITSATLTVPGIATTRITPLPVRVGMVDAGLTSRAVILYSGPSKRDVTGKMVISGTFVTGNTTRTFTRSHAILFP